MEGIATEGDGLTKMVADLEARLKESESRLEESELRASRERKANKELELGLFNPF